MKTLLDFFNQCADRFHDNIYLWDKGDRIALLSEARNDWVISELGILFCGAVNVPLSVRMNEPEEIRFRINHSGARMVIVSGNQLEKIRNVRNDLPGLEKIIVLDDIDHFLTDELWLGDVLKTGENFLMESGNAFNERISSALPDDYANISYTSGTTSDPKGIILTHSNFITNVEQAYSLMDIAEDYVTLLILPWDHAFAHTAGIYCFMGKGASIASVQSGKTLFEALKNIQKNIREIKPHLLFTVPAIAKNFRKNIEKSIVSRGMIIQTIFRLGLNVAYIYNGCGFDKGKGWKFLLKPLVALFDHLIFQKVREGFGGRLVFFIGGGALLDIELQKFFYAIGIPMMQGYGLTEAAPLISANSLHRHKLGSSGSVVDGLELKICDGEGKTLQNGDKGEIVIRGENVMAGYWMNEESTASAIINGWLHTGDMGYVDSDGFLYVLGRFKSLLIADDGEKYSPEGMEEAMMAQSGFIEQCMLYNNQNPYTVALVYPDKEKLLQFLREKELDPLSSQGINSALERIEHEFLEYRSGKKYGDQFPQRWLPSAIGILADGFTEQNHLLNFQLKTVRGRVVERYSHRIAELFTPVGKSIFNQQNILAMRTLFSLLKTDES
ncbi:MAG: AMP-binding protein [Bacteroidetes bacterium]|nr:AMP-binding protein [Bacteroidota bacterium]